MMLADGSATDPGLLALLGGDDDVAWRAFLVRYVPLVDAWCRHAGLQPADADDVRSQVLKGLITAMKGFRYDPARRFRGYLRAAVNNAIRKSFDERGRKPGNYGAGGGAQAMDELPYNADPLSLAAALDDSVSDGLRDLHRVVERVRAEVSDDAWRAYEFTAINGLSAAAAARALGKTVAAVYMAKSRVGRLLREESRRTGAGGPHRETSPE